MRVTKDMTYESGARILRDADYLGLDDTGVQVADDTYDVRLTVDSTSATRCKAAWLKPEDALGVAWLLIQRSGEVRGQDFAVLTEAWQSARQLARRIAGNDLTHAELTEAAVELAEAFGDIDRKMGQP